MHIKNKKICNCNNSKQIYYYINEQWYIYNKRNFILKFQIIYNKIIIIILNNINSKIENY